MKSSLAQSFECSNVLYLTTLRGENHITVQILDQGLN